MVCVLRLPSHPALRSLYEQHWGSFVMRWFLYQRFETDTHMSLKKGKQECLKALQVLLPWVVWKQA